MPRSLVSLVPLVALVGACSPTATATNGAVPGVLDGACPIEPAQYAIFEEGDVPLVLTSTHAGASAPLGCDPGDDVLRALELRVCEPELDVACTSGPCRGATPVGEGPTAGDRNARPITFALLDELEQCLGGRPHLALTEISRSIVDMNRDAHDPGGGLRCALEDEAALPYWEAYQRGVEGLVAHASSIAARGGGHALLVDLHTYASLPAAPPPSVMIGTGEPFGTTLPLLAAEDPTLARVFGPRGLRARLDNNFDALMKEDVAVRPLEQGSSLEGLFNGRYIVHRYARLLEDETRAAGPVVDALQIEVSNGARDDSLGAAHAIAQAICDAFGDRVVPRRTARDAR